MVNEKAKGYRLGSLQWNNEIDTLSKLVYEEGEGEEENVTTYQILGSLEILAIKK